VLVVLGDHQPASIVAGQGASHDVPVSIIAADRQSWIGRRTGAGRRGSSRTTAHRSGRWMPSGTSSSPLLARSPRPRPWHITERVQPRPVGTACPPTMRSLRSQSQASCSRTAGASCPRARASRNASSCLRSPAVGACQPSRASTSPRRHADPCTSGCVFDAHVPRRGRSTSTRCPLRH
jgi:hypothetical protein